MLAWMDSVHDLSIIRRLTESPEISCESIFRLIDLNARAGNKQKHEAAMSVHVGDRKHGDVNAQTRRTNEMHTSVGKKLFSIIKSHTMRVLAESPDFRPC